MSQNDKVSVTFSTDASDSLDYTLSRLDDWAVRVTFASGGHLVGFLEGQPTYDEDDDLMYIVIREEQGKHIFRWSYPLYTSIIDIEVL